MLCCMCVYALLALVIVWTIRLIIEKIPIGGFNSRPVLVTGCDTGFGYGLTLKLLRNGFPVFAGCLTQKVRCRSK
jgi:hypothetical protein